MKLSPESLARASSRHPWRTLGIWIVLIVAMGAVSSSLLSGVLSQDIAFTNKPESVKAQDILDTRFTAPGQKPDSSAFFRPIGPGTNARGHFHAAVFPYRPLPKGNVSLRGTISGLLATESARTVMHLLADEREFEGVGQTDLMRGACWVGPLRILGPAPQT